MPQRFLRIKNFEKYQPDTKRTYPWIKLYRSLLLDPDFLKLDLTSRYLYLCCLILASESSNSIPNDVSFLSHRCAIDVSLIDLRPLYRRGFLQAPRSTKYRLEREERRERGDLPLAPSSGAGARASRAKRPLPEELVLTDEERTQWERFGINAAIEFAAFKDHARTENRYCADWDAAKRNWMRKAIRLKEERHGLSPLRG